MSTDTTYLIHADEKYGGRVQHYIGSTGDLDARIETHRATRWERYPVPVTLRDGRRKNGDVFGGGATLLGAINAANIAWRVVRTWKGGRKVERRLKNWKNSRRLCPACNPKAECLARKVKA